LVNTFGQQGVGVDQLVNWSTKLIQEVEVDEVDQVSRSQLINWSASQGVEVDQLIKWSASQGVEVDQLIN
jgi:hypothetical protein